MSIWLTCHFVLKQTKIRDWCRIMPSAASLRDAYRARKGDKEHDDSLKVPQSFTFMAREGRGSSHFIVYCMCVCVCWGCLVSTSNWLCACACFGQDYQGRAMGFSSRKLFQGVWDLRESHGTSLPWWSFQCRMGSYHSLLCVCVPRKSPAVNWNFFQWLE